MKRREFVGGVMAAAAQATASADPLPLHIQKVREHALDALKPSAKELQHGLELHADAVVIEPYGFSPRTAPDGDILRRAVEAGASEVEIQDLTEEMTMTRAVESITEREEYMRAWRISGVTCIFQNAGEEGQDPLRLMKRLARFTYATDMLGDFVSRATRPDDILEAKRHKRHCLVMGTNGVPVPQRWISVEDELRYIRIFAQLGVRSMHLTYNRRNMIGDGCGEPANAGLSDFGRAVVAEMNRAGVIVDVAHSGWRTSLEAAKASGKPLIASHSCCAALNPHVRAKPDEVIRAIVDTGGFIGICAVGHFLGGTGDILAMLNHIDYVAKTFGHDAVAIATDLPYTSVQSGAEFAKVPRRGRRRAQWEALWPKGSYPNFNASSRTLSWVNWPLFTVGLVQRGYSDADIRKIIGGNALRVARAVFPEPATRS